jgi:hypothetical protein
MLRRILALAVIVRTTYAFLDTYPVIAWSTHNSNTLNNVPASFAPSANIAEVLNQLLAEDVACMHDAVVLVEHSGLHASDLRALSPLSPLVKRLEDASSAVQLAYVRRNADFDMSGYADSVASLCQSRVTRYTPTNSQPQLDSSEKHVVWMTVPTTGFDAETHKEAASNALEMISMELEGLASVFPNHLIILAGGQESSFDRRALVDDTSATALSGTLAKNSTILKGGIFAHYQLFTSQLIVSFLLVFLILIPALFWGITALSSIQAPVNMAAPKSFSADTKKNQ